MEQVQLGTTGTWVSPICLGMMSYGDPAWRDWVLPEADAAAFVRGAAEAGITFFDTADVYSRGVSEEITGALLRATFPRRDDYVLATKVGLPMGDGPNERGLSRRRILASIDASLTRLGVDHVDLYQIHRWDPQTPIAETMEALHDVVRSGKARYLGASSMRAWQFTEAQHVAERHGWTPFVTMQDHHNLLYREEEREMHPYCAATGVGVLPWSPLARGRLARAPDDAGATTRGRSDHLSGPLYDQAELGILAAVGRVAERHGVTRAQVASAWLLHQPAVTAPIVGATKLHHLDDAVAAARLTLEPDDLDELTEHYRTRPVLGHD